MKNGTTAVMGAVVFGALYVLGTWYPAEMISPVLYWMGVEDFRVLLFASFLYAIVINGGKLYFGELAVARIAPRGIKSLYWFSRNGRDQYRFSVARRWVDKIQRWYNITIYITVGLVGNDSLIERLLGYGMLFAYGAVPGLTTPGLVIALLSRNRLAQAVVVCGDVLRLYFIVVYTA